MIEANDRRSLAQRSLDELILKHPEAIVAAAELHEHLAALHAQFFEYRGGPATLIAASAV
jgi:hypothetical protein